VSPGPQAWSAGLARARRSLHEGLSRIFSGAGPAGAAALDDLEAALIAADAGPETAAELVEAVRSGRIPAGADGAGAARDALKERIRALLGEGGPDPAAFGEKPWVVLFVGVNGTGKTTTVGKMAHRFASEGRRVVLAAADTFRPAANEQLAIWAGRAGVPVIGQKPGADPASVAFDALDHAVRQGADALCVDTAGRLQTKVNLMEELGKIRRVLSKRMPSAPHETLLVIDATTGQNGLSQARRFTEAAGVTGIVLTKLDGTARGGVVLGIRRALGVPIRWAGLGEGIDDLVPFDAEAFAEGLLGEG
jgi:fused signal recognition particle receptor